LVRSNPSKTIVWWPTVDPQPAWRLGAGVGVCREGGLTLLGGFLTDSLNIRWVALSSKMGEVWSAIKPQSVLKDPQVELLLLRACAGVCRLGRLQRCTPPSLVGQGVETFDPTLQAALHRITVGEGGGG
jgi:hypothetical protein